MIDGVNYVSMPSADWSSVDVMRKGSFLETVKLAEEKKKLEERTAQPTHSLTEEQYNELNSKYDFSTMQRSVRNVVSDGKGRYEMFTTYSKEYISFLGDLVYMNVYSADEIRQLHSKPLPVHDSGNIQPAGGVVGNSFTNETTGIVQRAEEHISGLKKIFAYYDTRSKNPSEAVAGDEEYADTLNSLLAFNQQFFEMIKSLTSNFEDASGKFKEDFSGLV